MATPAGDNAAGSTAPVESVNDSGRSRGDGTRGRGRARGNRGRGRADGSARGGGAPRGRGRGNSTPHDDNDASAPPEAAPRSLVQKPKDALLHPPDPRPRADDSEQSDGDAEGEVCFICANPITHHSVAPCNHITCHICALRMRALYKTKDCPHCRTPAPFVIFTDDPAKRYEDYVSTDITSTDDNIGIKYANEDIVGDTILLLRYNCPDPSCDFAGLGWPNLHRHVRQTHHKKMCDLCTRNKKVFTHEHDLFADRELEKHMRHGDDRPGALDQTGFKGHPLCGFCGERFYDDDKLYEHCRNKHERCFICDRRDSRQPHYFQNYDALEEHFKKDHFLCLDRECLEKKFIVFESVMDLKAHQLSDHGDSLSKDVRRDARLVDMSDFDFRPTYEQERRSGRSGHGDGQGQGRGRGGHGEGHGRGRGGHGEGHGQGRGRGRLPDSEPLPLSSAQPLRRDELAVQRQMAIHSAQSISTRTFGGQLTSTPSATAPSSARADGAPAPSPRAQAAPLDDAFEALSLADAANLSPPERARLVRQGAVIERAFGLLGNDNTKLHTFRSDVSSYRNGVLNAPQLIDAFFALFTDNNSNALGTLVRELADLFEDKGKAEALRKAWQDWRAINEDYPSLPGLGGMHGATTSTSGWASAVAASPTANPTPASQRHTTRVLKLKSSTRRGSAASISSSTGPAPAVRAVPGTTWTAPARTSSPATSSPAFPALPGAASGARPAQSLWLGGTGTATTRAPRAVAPITGPLTRRPAAAAPANEEAFPALPAAPKPLTTIFGYGKGAVRRDVGKRDTGFSWGGDTGAAATAAGNDPEGENGDAAAASGGKGKKKGKKQVLAAWG